MKNNNRGSKLKKAEAKIDGREILSGEGQICNLKEKEEREKERGKEAPLNEM